MASRWHRIARARDLVSSGADRGSCGTRAPSNDVCSSMVRWRVFAWALGQASLTCRPLGGVLAGKVLKGAKLADLPIEQPTNLALVLNLKSAKVLGLTIPPAALARADEVIHP